MDNRSNAKVSEIYNPERGQFEEQFDTQTDFVVPELTEDERAAAEYLCLFGRSSNDPIDFVASCERDVQIHAYDLYDSGLELSNPGVQINFSERDLPLSVLMDVLVQKDLIHSRVCNQYEYIQGFRERRGLPTGGVLLMDKKLQMRGMAQAAMARDADRRGSDRRGGAGSCQPLGRRDVGPAPGVQSASGVRGAAGAGGRPPRDRAGDGGTRSLRGVRCLRGACPLSLHSAPVSASFLLAL